MVSEYIQEYIELRKGNQEWWGSYEIQEEKGERKKCDFIYQLMVVEGIYHFLCVVQAKEEIGGVSH